MQNNLEEREPDMHARKNVIAIIKKSASKLFVVILLASVFIGILTVITEEVRAETWNIETVDSDGDVGWDTSIALDSNGYPHISYLDMSNYDLKYAKWTGTAWSTTTVDSDGDVGWSTSIALDSKGYPHISYQDITNSYQDITNNDLKYAEWSGSRWSITTVDSDDGVGEYASIALDSNDYPHISYFDYTNNDLKYAKWTGTAWDIETVDSDGYVGEYTSIALDSKGYPHISYYDSTNYDLKYAKWTGTTWSFATLDFTGYPIVTPSITLDSNDYPHISYFDSINTDLKYAKWTGTAWNITTVDSGIVEYGCKVGGHTSIALDSNGYPHISYLDYTNEDLKYAKLMPTIPTPPRNLQATPGNKYVDLSWSAPSDEGGSLITECKIYRGTNSGGESYLASVSASATSYKDTTVTNGQTYYYHVTAGNVAGESSPSDEVSAKPQGPPSPSRKLQAAAGDGYVDLSWNQPSNDGGSPITGYKIYRGTISGGEIFVKAVGNVLIYTDKGVTNNQKFYYQVSAVNSVGEGEKSNDVGARPTSTSTSPTTTPTPTSTPTLPSTTTTPTPTSTPTLPSTTTTPTPTPTSTDTPPLDSNWMIAIIVALIGALGVIAAALINYLSSKNKK
jgi:cell division septation protein DedD